MKVGVLRDRVRIEEPSGTDGGGYAVVATVPAQIEMVDSGGTEVLRMGAPTATGYFKVTMRHRTDLQASWRLVHAEDGRVFQISSYGDPDGMRAMTRVFVTEIQ